VASAVIAQAGLLIIVDGTQWTVSARIVANGQSGLERDRVGVGVRAVSHWAEGHR